MFAGFTGDIATRRVLAGFQTSGREGKQAEVIVVRSVAVWRAGTAVIRSLEVISCLLEALLFGMLSGALRQRRQSGREVIGCPMVPCAARRIRIVAQQGKAARLRRRGAPF